MAIFKGTGVAIVTPMHEDGKVNFEKLEEILEDQIANSTDAIVICGTTGESSTLTHGEHLQTIKFTIDKVNKRVPVIAGTRLLRFQLYRDSDHDVQGSSFLWRRRSSYCNTLL